MSQRENIELHLQVIEEARKLPVGCNRRLLLFSRAIQGILRACQPDYSFN